MEKQDSYVLRCGNCRTKNRVPENRVGEPAKCGKCGTTFDSGMLRTGPPLLVSDSDFDKMVLNSPLPVLLDFFAPWCGPCRSMEPVLEELAGVWQGRLRICKLNVDNSPMTARRYQVRSTPTLMIFDNGQLRDTLIGALPSRQIMEKVYPHLYV